jgi:hypothetical protein
VFAHLQQRARVEAGEQGQPGQRDVLARVFGPQFDFRLFHVNVTDHLLQFHQRNAADQKADQFAEHVLDRAGQEGGFLQPLVADVRHVDLLNLSETPFEPALARTEPHLTVNRA